MNREREGTPARLAPRLVALGAAVLVAAFGVAVVAADHAPSPRALTRIDEAITMGKVGRSCTFRGKRMYGKVQVVQSFPDFKVQVVQHFPDLKVQRVTSFPDKCGRWQFVTSFPDFKIQFVKHFPDFTIQYVNHFPGVP